MLLRLIGAACILLSFGAAADNGDAEREALARLVHELKALHPLIEEAQTKADPSSRVTFNYGWLREDLAKICDGLQAHIDKPRAEPRTFAPLSGDYRR